MSDFKPEPYFTVTWFSCKIKEGREKNIVCQQDMRSSPGELALTSLPPRLACYTHPSSAQGALAYSSTFLCLPPSALSPGQLLIIHPFEITILLSLLSGSLP